MASIASSVKGNMDAAYAAVMSEMDALGDFKLFPGEKKWGTFIERAKWVINTVVSGAIDIAIGLVEVAAWILFKSYTLFIFLFYGIILLAVREFVLFIVLETSHVAVLLADIINVVLKFFDIGFNALFDCVNLFMAFVNQDVISAINEVIKIATFGSVHSLSTVPFHALRWKNVPPVSPAMLKKWLSGLPPTCTNFDGAWKIILYLFRMVGHRTMCPVVRYFYPLEQTYHTDIMPTLFGWTYYGSADPILYEPNKNCAGAGTHGTPGTDSSFQQSLNYTCIGLGLCYLFLEVFLAVTIIRVMVPALYKGVSKYLSLFFYGFEIMCVDGIDFTIATVKAFLLV